MRKFALSLIMSAAFLGPLTFSSDAYANVFSRAVASCLVTKLYEQILKREPDANGAYTSVDYILGSHTIWNLGENMALSPEFHDRFLAGKTPKGMARVMYVRLLNRQAENNTVVAQHASQIEAAGWPAGVKGFTRSTEFGNYWGAMIPACGGPH